LTSSRLLMALCALPAISALSEPPSPFYIEPSDFVKIKM